jgi:hypothetical protein
MDDDFKKKIVEDFGLENMSSADQDSMIEKIGNLLFESVVERSVDMMDDRVVSDFEKELDTAGGDYSKVVSFLKEKTPGFDEIVSQELTRLKRATSGMFA